MKGGKIKKRMAGSDNYIADLRSIVSTARKMSFRAANLMQVACNWLLGWRIVEQEQQGKARADYGKHIIQQASEALTVEFGKGFTPTVLRNFRKFYLEFPGLQVKQALPGQFAEALEKIQQPLVAKSARLQKQQPLVAKSSVVEQPLFTQLSWMHYESLMRVPDLDARQSSVPKQTPMWRNFQPLRRTSGCMPPNI